MKTTAKIALAFTLLSGSLFAVTSQADQTYASSVSIVQSKQQQHEKTLLKTRDLAKQGRVINSESFGLNTHKKDIIQKWGQPEESDPSPDGYLDYKKRGVNFNLISNRVSMVISDHKDLRSITYKEVQKVLGQGASDEGDPKGDTFTVQYSVGKNLLYFTFPKRSIQNKYNPKVLFVIVIKGSN